MILTDRKIISAYGRGSVTIVTGIHPKSGRKTYRIQGIYITGISRKEFDLCPGRETHISGEGSKTGFWSKHFGNLYFSTDEAPTDKGLPIR
jgi:hypothetical protein